MTAPGSSARGRAFPVPLGMAVAAAVAIVGLLRFAPGSWILAAAVVLIALWSDRDTDLEGTALPGWTRSLTAGAVLAYGARVTAIAVRDVRLVPDWDFKAFWLPARVAAGGGDFYRTEDLVEASRGLTFGPEFLAEVIEVGFLYPPLTMLLFAPFGFVERVDVALAVWYAIMAATIVACVFLLRPYFGSGRNRLDGFLMASAIVLLFAPTRLTVHFAQTNFLLLMVLLLLAQRQGSNAAGWLMATACAIKPMGALVFLSAATNRRWRAIGTAAGALLLALGFSWAVFGSEAFFGYFTSSPLARVPAYVYSEGVNQSLLATTIRWTDREIAHSSSSLRLLYFAGALPVLLLAVVSMVRGREKGGAVHALAVAVPTALLTYPGTLSHYALLLLLPLAYLWENRGVIPGGSNLALGTVAATFLLVDLGGGFVFGAIVIVWVATVLVGVLAPRQAVARAAAPSGAG